MLLNRILHRHGGRVVSIAKIGHVTTGNGKKGVAHWFYLGRVVWDDASVSESIEIPPFALCVDDGDHLAADAEYKILSAKMSTYLIRAGSWDSKRSLWIPIKPTGEKPIEAC